MKKIFYYLSITFAVISFVLASFFFVKMSQTQVLLDGMINDALQDYPDLNIEGKALKISDKIYRETNNFINRDELDWYSEWEATSFFNMSAAVGLEYNCFGIEGESGDGPCGTMTKIFIRALWDLNIPARKLQLAEFTEGRGGHTMAEFFYDGKWRVISPSDSSFVWRNADSSIATVEEIQSDTAIFNQVYHKWKADWPYGFKETYNINWEKLPGFVESIARFTLGDKEFDNVETPNIYEHPRKLLFLIFLGLSIFFIIIAYLIKRLMSKSLLL